MTMKKSRAFTLVETLVAISILLLSIGGPIFAVSNAVSSATLARDQITGFYLAQDALEYIRNLRDENTLRGGDWAKFVGIVSPCISNICQVDTAFGYSARTLTPCPQSIGCQKLNYVGNIYDYAAGGYPSIFTRSVKIIQPPATSDHEMDVQVTISWIPNNFSSPKTFTVTDELLDWQQY